MNDESSGHRATNARRGLATIAFLKARFDAGMDHLDMFQPFVEDAVRRSTTDDIELTGIRREIRDWTGLSIPTDVVKTLLQRAAKKKLLTRAGGRYLRTQDYGQDPKWGALMSELELAHQGLAARLRRYAGTRGDELTSDDDALTALTRFLDAHHIGVVLGQPIDVKPTNSVARLEHTVAAFVAETVREGGADCATLENIVKGLIVQNALLLRDIPIAERHLDGLTVYIDSGILLRALGYAGPTERQATTEALGLIRAAGARLRAFERTVHEAENILRVYEHKLGSSAGIKNLRETPLTRHFLRIRATPAEIRQEIALVVKNLEILAIRVSEFPKHAHKYTEDEQSLADALRDPTRNQDSDDTRVWHDVRVIAAVITLRAGARPNRVSNAGYVFASGSSRTVSSASRWYRQIDPRGLEPIVHFRSVTNAAWFLRPAHAADVPMHELVAVCAAVLRPSPEIWSSFVKRLNELVRSGELSDDESIAVVASEFTRVQLANLEADTDVEATTVREIVERVKAEEQTKFSLELDQERRKREESDRAAVTAREETASIRRAQRAHAEKLAAWVARVIYGLLCIVLVLGAIWTLPTKWSNSTRAAQVWNLVWWGCVAIFSACSLLGFLTRRFHVLNAYDWLKTSLTPRMRRLLFPENERNDR